MERQQAGSGGLDETISTLREGIGRPKLEAVLDRVEGRRLRLAALGAPELEPMADGLARLGALAGLLEHEGQRLADAQR